MKNIARILGSRGSRRGFTFIELVVAVALTAILLRAMYSVFMGATSLARLSEEKTNAVYEAAAASDCMAIDTSRSPFFSTNYYLVLPAGGQSILFQAMKQNGLPGFVYIEYYFQSNRIMRRVWNHRTSRGADNIATVSNDGEDGAATAVAYNVQEFWAYFLNDAYRNNGRLNIDETACWLTSGTLSGTSRTRAIKMEFVIQSVGDIPAQRYTLVFPIMFS